MDGAPNGISSISRLRAEGVITAEMTGFVVRFGDIEQTVGVALLRFPNGGSWSFFDVRIAPGRRVCFGCSTGRYFAAGASTLAACETADRAWSAGG